MATTVDETSPASAHGGRRVIERLAPHLVAVSLTVPLIALAVATARGLDLSDEGFYLISVSDPDEYLESASHYQFPLWLLWVVTGHPIPARLLRLCLYVACGVFLGTQAERAIQRRIPTPRSTLAATSTIATAVAGALAPYVWLPQSPGYNDIVSWCTILLLGAAVTRSLDGPDRRRPWLAFAAGLALWVLLLTKWPAALIAIVVATVWFGRRSHRVDGVRAGSAFIAAALVTHVAAAPLGSLWTGLVDGTRSAGEKYESSGLLTQYVDSLTSLPFDTVREHPIIVLGVTVVGAFLGWRPPERAPSPMVAGVAGMLVPLWFLVGERLPAGDMRTFGPSVASLVTIVLWFLVVYATGRTVADRRPEVRRLDWIGVACLAAPFAAAVGTNNPLLVVAAILLTTWLVGLLLLAAAVASDDASARGFVTGLVTTTAVLTAVVAVGTTWSHPYRQPPLSEADVRIESGPFEGLAVDPDTARAIDDLIRIRDETGAQIAVTIGPISGLAAATDLDQPLFGWLRAERPDRVLRSLEAACADEGPVIVAIFDPDVETPDVPPDCSDRRIEQQGSSTSPRGTVVVWVLSAD